jgi:hypothetical protein
MARFFFHLHECGSILPDDEGVEREPCELHTAALAAARDVMCGEIVRGKLCLSCFILIKDENRQEVMRVTFREAVDVSGL